VRGWRVLGKLVPGLCLQTEYENDANPIDSAGVARFADEFFPREMPRRRIPGLVFVFVSSGEITVARGYGAAELASQRRVDPDRTRFRLASVSKPITANCRTQACGGRATRPAQECECVSLGLSHHPKNGERSRCTTC
jgi:CubicO group peptidase (beta-lactamase class C family)